VFLFCDCAVQQDLLKGDEDADFIKKLSKKITMPVLILWGDHDKVSTTGDLRVCQQVWDKLSLVVRPLHVQCNCLIFSYFYTSTSSPDMTETVRALAAVFAYTSVDHKINYNIQFQG
jgi:hypothetical protein